MWWPSVSSLSRKYIRAQDLLEESQIAFVKVDEAITPELRKAWSDDASLAAEGRSHDKAVMDIYDVRLEEGSYGPSFCVMPFNDCVLHPKPQANQTSASDWQRRKMHIQYLWRWWGHPDAGEAVCNVNHHTWVYY